MLKNTDIAMLKHLAYKFTSSNNNFNPKFVNDLIDTANDQYLSREEAIVEIARSIFNEMGTTEERREDIYQEGYQEGYDDANDESEYTIEDVKIESYDDGYNSGYQQAEKDLSDKSRVNTYENAFNDGYQAAIDGKDKIDIDDSVSESYFQEIIQENFDEGFNRGYEKAKKEGEQ